MGLPVRATIPFGRSSVSGRRRWPSPPAMMIACMAVSIACAHSHERGELSPLRLLHRLCRLEQIGDPIGLLPGRIDIVPPEVPVRRRRPVNRTSQPEVANDAVRAQVEYLPDEVGEGAVVELVRTEALDGDA